MGVLGTVYKAITIYNIELLIVIDELTSMLRLNVYLRLYKQLSLEPRSREYVVTYFLFSISPSTFRGFVADVPM